MSDGFKVGSVVRYRLNDQEMTISDAGPLKAMPIGVGSRVVSGPTPSPDLVVCKWFAGQELQVKRFKKSELDLIADPVIEDVEMGDLVELVSGGPKMMVVRTGPKSSAVGAMAVGGRIRSYAGSARNDLIGCKWVQGKSEKTQEFEIGTLRLLAK